MTRWRVLRINPWSIMANFLGKDLHVIANFVAHDAAQVDLVRKEKPVRALFGAGAANVADFGVLEGRENLAQALTLRLLTPRGALAALGHAEYGSRLQELIGERKTEALRNLCRVFVLEVVAQEPRVENQAVVLRFDVESETPSSFVFILEVQPVAGGDPLSLSLEVGI